MSAEAKITIKGDNQASAVLKKVDKDVKKSADQWRKDMMNKGGGLFSMDTFKDIGKALAPVGILAAAFGFAAKKAADFAETIEDGANIAGMSNRAFQQLAYIAGENGLEVDKLTANLNKLQNIQNGIATDPKAQKAFEKLGISVKEVAKANPADLLKMIAKGFKETGNIGSIYDIFGKGAGEVKQSLLAIADAGHNLKGIVNGTIVDDQAIVALGKLKDSIGSMWRSALAGGAKFFGTMAIGWSGLKDLWGDLKSGKGWSEAVSGMGRTMRKAVADAAAGKEMEEKASAQAREEEVRVENYKKRVKEAEDADKKRADEAKKADDDATKAIEKNAKHIRDVKVAMAESVADELAKVAADDELNEKRKAAATEKLNRANAGLMISRGAGEAISPLHEAELKTQVEEAEDALRQVEVATIESANKKAAIAKKSAEEIAEAETKIALKEMDIRDKADEKAIKDAVAAKEEAQKQIEKGAEILDQGGARGGALIRLRRNAMADERKALRDKERLEKQIAFAQDKAAKIEKGVAGRLSPAQKAMIELAKQRQKEADAAVIERVRKNQMEARALAREALVDKAMDAQLVRLQKIDKNTAFLQNVVAIEGGE